MSELKDFVIENGVLKKYQGPGGDVVIPEGVTRIDDEAFAHHWNLTSVSFPCTLLSIGYEAFEGCADLASAVIPKTVEGIEEYAFKGCRSLVSLGIPDSVKSVGKYAFAECTGLSQVTVGNGITEIEEGVFEECSSLSSIELPEHLVKIERYAFCKCKKLAKIDIPNGVKEIGNLAFYGCSVLSNIMIPDVVTRIGDSAFGACAISEIVIPENVEALGKNLICECKKLLKISVHSANKKYHSDGNCLIDTVAKKVIAGCKKSVIPSDGSVTAIGDSAFRGCTGLVDIVLPSCITALGDSAFSECRALGSIKLPDKIEVLESGVFSGCTSLASITLPDWLYEIRSAALKGCSSLTQVIFPGGVSRIGQEAFKGCSSLLEIDLPYNCLIGDGAFADCIALRKIQIPKPKVLPFRTFDMRDYIIPVFGVLDTEKLTMNLGQSPAEQRYLATVGFAISESHMVVEYDEAAKKYWTKAMRQNRKKLYQDKLIEDMLPALIKYGVIEYEEINGLLDAWREKAVAVAALLEYKSQLETPSTLKKAKKREDRALDVAFGAPMTISEAKKNWSFEQMPDGTLTLTSYKGSEAEVYVPSAIADKKVTAIGMCAFEAKGAKKKEREAIEKIVIPEGVVSIGSGAFKGCCNLVDVNIPSTMTFISGVAFAGCSKLSRVSIPDSVTTIGESAFADCTMLTDIKLPSALTEISNGLFENCYYLGSISLPETVTRIGARAFKKCIRLASFVIPAGVCEIGNQAFMDTPDYKSAKAWKNNMLVFGHCLIRVKLKTTECIVPDNVTVIAYGAFEGCKSLENLVIPEPIKNKRNYKSLERKFWGLD